MGFNQQQPPYGYQQPPYGYQQPQYQYQPNINDPFKPTGPEGKCRGVAALLAIFLGAYGIHFYYLGKNSACLISIGLTFITCGLWGLITFIQGIIMLTMTNDAFQQKYVATTSNFPLF